MGRGDSDVHQLDETTAITNHPAHGDQFVVIAACQAVQASS